MIYSIGEALIDLFTQNSKINEQYTENAGGTNANIAAAIAKLGGEVALITKLGNDKSGGFLCAELQKTGVDTSKIFFDSTRPTGKIIVSPDIFGTSFCALRNNAADRFLNENEIDISWFSSNDILVFCSSGLVNFPTKYAHLKAIKATSNAGGTVVFDINLRPKLWNNRNEYISTINDILQYVNILKMSSEEYKEIFGEKPPIHLFDLSNSLEKVIITSEKGILFLSRDDEITLPSFKTKVVDTTGAGDCFLGSFLFNLHNNQNPTKYETIEMLLFSLASSALSVQKLGTITAFPSRLEALEFLEKMKKVEDF